MLKTSSLSQRAQSCRLLPDLVKAVGAGGSSTASKDAEQREWIPLFMLMEGCWKCLHWVSLCCACANISHQRGWSEGGSQNVSSADCKGMFPHASFLLCVSPVTAYQHRHWPATLHPFPSQCSRRTARAQAARRRGRQTPKLLQLLFCSRYDCCLLL